MAEGFARAKEYARKALELDDSVAEAHSSLAWATYIYDWDWVQAGREFQRAIALDPRYPTARQWYAFFLAAMGRMDEGLVEGHTALELDPASVSIRRSLGWLYHYARRYDQARYHLTRAIEMNPTAAETYRVLSLVMAQQGDWQEAERVVREGMTLQGAGAYTASALGYVLARTGQRAEAEGILADLTARGQAGYVSSVAFATLHLGLENWPEALTWTERGWPVSGSTYTVRSWTRCATTHGSGPSSPRSDWRCGETALQLCQSGPGRLRSHGRPRSVSRHVRVGRVVTASGAAAGVADQRLRVLHRHALERPARIGRKRATALRARRVA